MELELDEIDENHNKSMMLITIQTLDQGLIYYEYNLKRIHICFCLC
jgi:hypothetical protein